MGDTLQLLVDNAEPPEPFRLVRFGPQRGVGVPNPPDLALLAPILERRLDILFQIPGKFVAHRVELAAQYGSALLLHRGIKLVGSVGEEAHPVVDKLCRHRIDRNADTGECVHDRARRGDILIEAGARPTMITMRIHRRRRHRVDRVGADQLIDIEDVAVGLVLGPGTRPQEPLCLRALLRKALPAFVSVDLFVELIGELGIGDRHLALEPLQPRLLGRVGGCGDLFIELIVDQRVDAADEKARHAGNLMRVAALLGESLEPGNIGLGHVRIDLPRKQQGHVDVDPLADQGSDGG